jgi:hypothetical protein
MKFYQKQFMQLRVADQIGKDIRVSCHVMVLVGNEEPEEDLFENPWRLKVPMEVDGHCMFCGCYVLSELCIVDDQTPHAYTSTGKQNHA